VYLALLAALALLGGALPLNRVEPALADSNAQPLPYSQAWADAGQIVANDSWTGVPGVVGYLGQDITTATGANPQTLLTESASATDVDVIANQTNTGITNGGVAEFAILDPVVALQGSGTADAPYLLISLDTTGRVNLQVSYNLRDIDGSTDNAIQQVALQYRVGSTGAFTNVPAAYIADATSGPSLATLVTPVSVSLPSAVNDRAVVQIRMITTNAVGNDEWVGVDDISITSDDRAPSIRSIVPASGSADVPVDANVSITFSEPVSVTDPWFSLSCETSGNHVAGVSGGPTTFTLDPTVDFSANESCQVGVTAASVADVDGDDPPDAMNSNASFAFTTGAKPDEAPTVASTLPANGAQDVDLAANVSITFSEAVGVSGSWFTIDCADSGSHGAAVSGGPVTFTLDPDTAFDSSETCTVTVLAANVTDQDGADPPDSMTDDHAFSFTTTTGCGDPATAIHDIQGAGPASPLVGQPVEIEGVVVGDFQPSTSFNSFFVQEEDAQIDANPVTSEGIVVFEGSSAVDVALGDVVRVRGTVSEFTSTGITLTQVSTVTRVLVCSSGASVTAAAVTLPFEATTFPERYEGMLVQTTQALTVSETFGLGRFGELVLSSEGRLINPTNVVEPGVPAQAMQAANDRNRIVLDDGDNRQNVDPTLYPSGGLAADHTLRVGATVAAGKFVLEQRFGLYRFQPVQAVQITSTNPRPGAPAPVGGNLRAAALNVLNYFTTLNTGPGGCGPAGDLDCRGANTTVELDRQRAKTVAEIIGLDADILGLMEIQNDAGATLVDLVGALNAATAPGTYAFIDTGTIGTDAIKVALLYRPASVSPVGAHAILDHTVDARFRDTLNRPTLAQTFDTADGGRLTVVVNHLKSKGSDCNAVSDPDTGDGQGNCNETRTLAAQAMTDWLAGDPTNSGDRDVLVLGDLNSYAREDPIDVFTNAGFTNLIEAFLGGAGYSYVFQGQTGYLDHALASPTLAAQVTGTTEWHINADEPPVLDYNVEFKSAGHVSTLYAPTAYRSSDHDPVLVGINLLAYGFSGFRSPVDNPPAVNRVNAGQAIPIKFTLNGDLGLDVLFGTPTAARFACSTGIPTGAVDPTATSDGSGLTYDPASGVYAYGWKTIKAWADQCRTFSLTLDDGTYRTADFHFKK
jgi:predicted extracellular nuclease